MKSLPSRRLSRFGVSRSAGRSGSTAAAQSEGGADTTVSASQSEVTASPSTILNDGSTTSTITVTLRNASGVPLSGKTITLSSTGSNNTIVQPGTTDGNGEATGTIATTTAESKTITAVSESITVTDTATVTASVLGEFSPMFLADWGTAGGNGATALTDGGVFDQVSPDYTQNGTVIAAPSGYGWNTSNILEVTSPTGTRSGWLELSTTVLGVQAEGEVRNYRVAFVNVHPTAAEGATDHSHHGWQDGYPSGAGSFQNWNLTDGTNYTGEWEPSLLVITSSRYFLGSIATPTRLNKNERYTFEVQLVRGTTGAGTSNAFRLRAWVYDDTGAEIYGPSDWKSQSYVGETLATDRWLTYNNVDGTQQLNIGLNGTSGTWPITFGYWGEPAAVSSDDNVSLTAGTAIGPYGSCTGE